MRIQELERQVGIERATIRFYEKEGLITPERSENGYRDYSDADAAELKRIRLLRELGVSLDTIRELQAGKVDFAAVMRRQSQILQGRRDQMERARIVCDRISEDNATYLGLDIDRYQTLLNAPLLPQPVRQGSGTVFEEREYREPHPWRRFFARFLDYQIATVLLWCILVFVLRWRVGNALAAALINYAAWFLMIPLEAAWLHFCSTTPGKWIFGIRVEAVEGGKLFYNDALTRSWKVLHAGMAFNVPLLRLYCMYKGYRAHKDSWDTDWDEDCEIIFRDHFSWVNIVMAIAVFLAAGGVDYVTEREMQLPRHQSDKLTMAQFAENYNYFNEIIWDGTLDFMEKDGRISFPEYTQSMVLPEYGELEYDPYAQFEYELEGDVIKAITFSHTWYERDWTVRLAEPGEDLEKFGYWAPPYCQQAVLVAIASQDGISVDEFGALHRAHSEDCGTPCGDGLTAAYGDITFTWDLDLKKYIDYDVDSINSDVYEVTLDMRIEF